MTSAAARRLHGFSAEHPEWSPWLAVVGQALAAVTDPRWEEFVPAAPQRLDRTPLLAQASAVLSIGFLRRWLRQLLHCAAESGTPELATLKAAERSNLEALQLFHAALAQDSRQLEHMALDCGVNARAFQGVAELMPVPFLHACRRLWAKPNAESWAEGYCPTCGAWPAFAEARGIEKARYLRCGRCGEEWQTYGLRCPFCSNDDHEQLISLVPDNGASTQMVESCKRCSGYVKLLTRLQGGDGLDVMLDDLASVDLDIAAVEQGYRRPEGLGYAVNPTLGYSKGIGSRILPWSW
jgi:FdhE protein